MGDFRITGNERSDRLLDENPLALVVGMLLDQQVTMEWAFRGAFTLAERLGSLDAHDIVRRGEAAVVEAACRPPAIHRFPAVMARRIHALCTVVVDRYAGDVSRVWSEAADATDLHDRLRALPGFGDEKAKIFIALLAKRFGITPSGWESVSAPFSDDVPRSAADVSDPESLARVKEWKRRQRAEGKGKQD